MISVHPFTTARESILPLWSSQAQSRRQAPDSQISELFVLLHGMLFTNIQRDDFEGVLARFEEKLVIEGKKSDCTPFGVVENLTKFGGMGLGAGAHCRCAPVPSPYVGGFWLDSPRIHRCSGSLLLNYMALFCRW